MQLRNLIVVIVFGLVGCNEPVSPQNQVRSEEYAVYDCILDSVYMERWAPILAERIRAIVIEDSTVLPEPKLWQFFPASGTGFMVNPTDSAY